MYLETSILEPFNVLIRSIEVKIRRNQLTFDSQQNLQVLEINNKYDIIIEHVQIYITMLNIRESLLGFTVIAQSITVRYFKKCQDAA